MRLRTRKPDFAFTIAELIVTFAVLTLVIIFVTRLFNIAAAITTMGNNRMDADAQARLLLDRVAIDFWRMVKRPDLDYYLKSPSNAETGNDQIAFFTQVAGYYPSTGS